MFFFSEVGQKVMVQCNSLHPKSWLLFVKPTISSVRKGAKALPFLGIIGIFSESVHWMMLHHWHQQLSAPRVSGGRISETIGQNGAVSCEGVYTEKSDRVCFNSSQNV